MRKAVVMAAVTAGALAVVRGLRRRRLEAAPAVLLPALRELLVSTAAERRPRPRAPPVAA